MATSLKIALELDDRGYLTGIKAVKDETKKVVAETERLSAASNTAFTNLGQNISVAISRIAALVAAYAGLNAITGAYKMADDLDDLSKATGISIQKILQLQNALRIAGGNSEDAGKMIATLTNTIDAARDGSGEAQERLAKLNFSFKEMSNLTPEQALQKTINALANITDPIQRNALAFQLLGKSAKAIDWTAAAAETEKSTEKYDANAAAARQAAAAFETFGGYVKDLKIALMTALTPLNEMLAFFDKLGGGGVGGMALAAFRTTFEAVAILAANVGFVISTIYKDIVALYDAGAAVLSSPFKGESWKNASKIMTDRATSAQEAARQLEETEKRILGLNKQQTAEADKQADKKGKTTGTAPAVAPYYLKEVEAIRQQIKAYKDLADNQLQQYRDQTKLIGRGDDLTAYFNDQIKITQQYQQAIDDLTKKEALLRAGPQNLSTAAQLAEIRKAREELTKTYDKATEAQDAETQSRIRAITQNNLNVMTLNDEISLRQRLNDLTLQNAKLGLTELEKKYKDVEAAALRSAEAALEAEARRKFGVNNQGQINYKGENLFQLPKLDSLAVVESEITKTKQNITELEAVVVTAARTVDQEWEQMRLRYLEGVKARIEKEKEGVRASYENSRDFLKNWDDAFKAYVDNATNAGRQARDMFASITKGLEDVIVNFVKTGKLNFRDFANSIIEQFVRIQAQKLIAGIFDFGGSAVGGAVKALVGARALGGPVAANSPYLVGERGPELFIPSASGRIMPNNQLATMTTATPTNVVYNIQAVDAMSFRQMVARDPEFIYAVTERGRSALPNRR